MQDGLRVFACPALNEHRNVRCSTAHAVRLVELAAGAMHENEVFKPLPQNTIWRIRTMTGRIFGTSMILALLLCFGFVCICCVSTGQTTGQAGEETPTPKPTPTEEPSQATPEVTGAQTEAPTSVPTQKPTAPPRVPGSSWIVPEEVNTNVNGKFTTEIHVHTGDKQKIAAYGFQLKYDKNAIALDTSFGNNGVEAGPQGFINAINANVAGQVKIAGFDVTGKNPGNNLSFLVVHWVAKAKGSSDIELSVLNINDNQGNPIGTPSAFGATVNVK
jgi:hypothetical protein